VKAVKIFEDLLDVLPGRGPDEEALYLAKALIAFALAGYTIIGKNIQGL